MIIDQFYKIDEDSELYGVFVEWKNYVDDIANRRHDYIFNEMKALDANVFENGAIHFLRFAEGVEVPEGLKNKSDYDSNAYFPDRRTKIGKDLAEKFHSFQKSEPVAALQMMGHKEFFAPDNETGGHRVYNARLGINNNGVLLARVPVSDDYPFQPLPCMKEILPSLFNALAENKDVE
jgi:hypothetical protein